MSAPIRHYILISLCMAFLFIPGSALLYAQEDQPPPVEVLEEDEDEETPEEEREYYFIYKEYRDAPPPPQFRTIPSGRIRDLKKEKAFWYADAEFEAPELKPEQNSRTYIPIQQRVWFRTLLWLVIIGGFAAFLMIYLTGNRVGLFRRKAKEEKIEEEEEVMPEDIFAINYQREIDKAAAQGNFRMAIRLMYLRLLKELSEREIIRYSQGKTNFDYLMQMHPTPYYPAFFRATRSYEYAWYGKFPVSEEAYHLIRKDFSHLENKIIV